MAVGTPAAKPAKPLFSNVSPAVPSPCISICRLDEDKVCTGCQRHVEDIREWRSATDERRREIVRQADLRRSTSSRQACE